MCRISRTDLSKKTFVTFSSSRYGTDVAAVTDAALATAGNSYLTFYNAGALGRCSDCSVDLYNADTALQVLRGLLREQLKIQLRLQ